MRKSALRLFIIIMANDNVGYKKGYGLVCIAPNILSSGP